MGRVPSVGSRAGPVLGLIHPLCTMHSHSPLHCENPVAVVWRIPMRLLYNVNTVSSTSPSPPVKLSCALPWEATNVRT